MLLFILLHTVFCVLIATFISNTVRVIFVTRKEVHVSSKVQIMNHLIGYVLFHRFREHLHSTTVHLSDRLAFA